MKKNTVSAVILILLGAFTISGCMESHYYKQNNRHSNGYYQRRHMAPPAGVRVEIRK